MATEHKDITDAQIHQPKGAASATAGAIIACNGSGGTATTDNSSTPVNLYDNELRRAEMKDYSETVQAVSSSSGAATIDFESGNVITTTLTENITTLTLSNPPSTGNAGSATVIITQGGSGAYTITWPASVKWAGGSAPTLSTGVGDIDIIGLLTTDGGTTYYGFNGGINFS